MAWEDNYTLELTDMDRQVVLMALAHLMVKRPQWNHWVETIAGPIDEKDGTGGPKLLRHFARIEREAPFDVRLAEEMNRRELLKEGGAG